MKQTIDVVQASDLLETWRRDPVPFIRKVLRGDPWDGQEEIARAVAQNKQVAVRSCNAIGKDWIAAQLALWWLTIWEEAAVVTLSPSWHQTRDLTWRDLHSAYHKSTIPIGGTLNQTGLQLSEKRFAVGLATDRKERVMGIHNEHLFIIVTESSGVEEEVMDGLDTMAAGGDVRVLLLGNPTVLKGTFYEAFHKNRASYKTLHYSYENTPNFKMGAVVRPYLIQPWWVDDKRRKWGEGSVLWQVHILGNFPSQAADALISLEWVEKAQARWSASPPSAEVPSVIGVDVARAGDAETVFQIRRGPWAAEPECYIGWDQNQIVGRIKALIEEENPEAVYVDAIGIGAGVVDACAAEGLDDVVVGVIVAEKASDPKRFANLRAEMWWELRNWLQQPDSQIPEDDFLGGQLTSVKYTYSRNGLVLESKEQARRRGVPSPDRGDALALTQCTELGLAPSGMASVELDEAMIM